MVSAVLADPLSILTSRSPGGRGAGALMSTKPLLSTLPNGTGGIDTAGAPVVPTERVLPTVRDRPAAGFEPIVPAGPGAGGLGGLGGPSGGIEPGGNGFVPFPGDGGGGGIFPGGGTVPSGGGGGGTVPGGDGTPPPPPPVSPIPEPASWVMMILGVFAIGAMLRRRRLAGRIGQARS